MKEIIQQRHEDLTNIQLTVKHGRESFALAKSPAFRILKHIGDLIVDLIEYDREGARDLVTVYYLICESFCDESEIMVNTWAAALVVHLDDDELEGGQGYDVQECDRLHLEHRRRLLTNYQLLQDADDKELVLKMLRDMDRYLCLFDGPLVRSRASRSLSETIIGLLRLLGN